MKPAWILCCALAAVAPLPAQEAEPSVEDLVRQIQRNMEQVETDLSKLDAEHAREAGARVKEDIERLIESSKAAGQQVTRDIESILKQMKLSQGSGSGQEQSEPQSEGQPQRQPGARDRNRPQPGGKPQPGQEPSGQPKDGSQEDPAGGANRRGRPPEPPEEVKVTHQQLMERWGILPPELRQKLVERNFKDFTPEYEAEIRAYLKSIQQPAR